MVARKYVVVLLACLYKYSNASGNTTCFYKQDDYCGALRIFITRPLEWFGLLIYINICQSGFSIDEISRNERVQFHNISRLPKDTSIKVISNYFIELCGFTKSDYGDCHKFRCENSPLECNNNQTTRELFYEYPEDYELTSLSCGRPVYNIDECTPTCHTTLIKSKTTNCAMLYRSDNCGSCYNPPIPLSDGQIFMSENSAVIRSLNVVPGCVVAMNTFGNLGNAKNETTYFHTSQSSVKPSYYKDGELFSCSCESSESPHTIEISDTTNLSESTTEFTVEPTTVIPAVSPKGTPILKISLSVAFGLFAVIVVISALVCYFRSRKSARNESASNEVQFNDLPEVEGNDIPRHCLTFEPNNSKFVIGEGRFGKVVKGKLKVQQGCIYIAVKIASAPENVQFLKNEIKMMKSIGLHSNIVHFIGACWTVQDIDVVSVMELCELGCLLNYLREMKILENTTTCKIKLLSGSHSIPGYVPILETQNRPALANIYSTDTFHQLVTWSKEIATGMEYLNHKNVLHTDLAASNILLDKNKVAKISDFGLSKELNAPQKYGIITDGFAPVKWVALECLTDSKFSIKSDVWAYGITLWEIFSLGCEPYVGQGFEDVFRYIRSGNRLGWPEFATADIYAEMLACWDENPEGRPHFKEFEAFFGNINAKGNGEETETL